MWAAADCIKSTRSRALTVRALHSAANSDEEGDERHVGRRAVQRKERDDLNVQWGRRGDRICRLVRVCAVVSCGRPDRLLADHGNTRSRPSSASVIRSIVTVWRSNCSGHSVAAHYQQSASGPPPFCYAQSRSIQLCPLCTPLSAAVAHLLSAFSAGQASTAQGVACSKHCLVPFTLTHTSLSMVPR